MKITRIQVVVTCPGRNYVLLKIETDEPGLYGWGDATLNGRELAVATLLEAHIAPLLIGRDPDCIEDIWQYIFRGTYWRGGPVLMTALAGVDLALWDIKGKRAGLPVYSLLGGKTRAAALAYTHCHGYSNAQVEDAVRAAQERGFKVMRAQQEFPAHGTGQILEVSGVNTETPDKSLPGLEYWEPSKYLRAIPKLFDHLRARLGDDIELLHDVHERIDPIEAARLAKDLEDYHLFFLEDPVRPEHTAVLESFRLIRQHTSIPLAMGELFVNRWDALALITEQLIDFVRCDLAHIGGLTEARKIAAIAESYHVRTAWHGPGDIAPITHAANVHLDLAIPNFGIQEMTFFPERVQEVISGGPTYDKGYLWVTDRPGLGTDVDEKAAAKYPYERAYLPTMRRLDGSVQDW